MYAKFQRVAAPTPVVRLCLPSGAPVRAICILVLSILSFSSACPTSDRCLFAGAAAAQLKGNAPACQHIMHSRCTQSGLRDRRLKSGVAPNRYTLCTYLCRARGCRRWLLSHVVCVRLMCQVSRGMVEPRWRNPEAKLLFRKCNDFCKRALCGHQHIFLFFLFLAQDLFNRNHIGKVGHL